MVRSGLTPYVSDAAKVRLRAPDAAETVTHPSEDRASGFLRLASLVTGLSLALDRFVPLEIGGLTVSLMIAFGFATLGWWIGVTEPVFRKYLRLAVPFVLVAMLSLVVNDFGGLASTAGILMWFVMLAGIASLLQQPRLFRAMLLGLTIGAGFLLFIVVLRLAAGLPALDGYRSTQLLGVNRNAVDISIVWLIPAVALSPTLNLNRFMRLIFIGSAVLWLVSSKGRTGLISLLLIPLLLFALKPPKRGGSRAPRLFVVVAVGYLVFVGLGTVSVPFIPAVNRLERVENGATRSQSDDIRILLNKKSQRLGWKHPVFGIGFGQYAGAYDPILDTGRTPHIREGAANAPSHNTYLDAFATTGVTGLLLFVGMLSVPLIFGIRRSDDEDVRALTVGYAVMLFGIAFHTSYGTVVYLPMALTLAAVARAERQRALARVE